MGCGFVKLKKELQDLIRARDLYFESSDLVFAKMKVAWRMLLQVNN